MEILVGLLLIYLCRSSSRATTSTRTTDGECK